MYCYYCNESIFLQNDVPYLNTLISRNTSSELFGLPKPWKANFKTGKLLYLLPAQKRNQKNQIPEAGQDQPPSHCALAEKTQGRCNNMDQTIKGECLQYGWIYQQIFKIVYHGKGE